MVNKPKSKKRKSTSTPNRFSIDLEANNAKWVRKKDKKASHKKIFDSVIDHYKKCPKATAL